MNETTMNNFKASLEVRELKDELSEKELKKVSGGMPVGPPLHTPQGPPQCPSGPPQ